MADPTSAPVLSSDALCSVAEFFRYAPNIPTSYTPFVIECINAASADIKKRCDRQLIAADLVHHISGNLEQRINLPEWPVSSIYRVAYGMNPVLTVSAPATVYASATIGITATGISTYGVKLDGTVEKLSMPFATYPTTTSVESYLLSQGWTAKSTGNYRTAWLNVEGNMGCVGPSAWFTYPIYDWTRYTVDYDTGQIEFNFSMYPMWGGSDNYGISPNLSQPIPAAPIGFKNLLIAYRAGYEEIPADLNMLARWWAVMVFNATSVNPVNKSERVGDRGWTTYSQVELEADKQAVISKYSRKGIGLY